MYLNKNIVRFEAKSLKIKPLRELILKSLKHLHKSPKQHNIIG